MSQVDNFTEGIAGAYCISCLCCCCCQVWARVCGKGVDGVLCGAQTHKCPKEGSNRSVQNLRFQGRGLLTIDPCLISKILAY